MNLAKFGHLWSKQIQKEMTAPTVLKNQELILAKVLSHETLNAGLFKYKYQITPAWLDDETGSTTINTVIERHILTPPTDHIQFDAYSISELGNDGSHVSYGVLLSNLPATVDPVPIPDGTPVIAMANRSKTGKFHYMIINTQAITGAC